MSGPCHEPDTIPLSPWMAKLDAKSREAVRRNVAAAPRLSDRQRERLRLLFRDTRRCNGEKPHGNWRWSMPREPGPPGPRYGESRIPEQDSGIREVADDHPNQPAKDSI
jgi:hypothetical protein